MKKALFFSGVIILVISGWFVYLSKSAGPQINATQPVITVMDILHASDLTKGVKKAVREGDDEALNDWLEKAIEVARQAGLPQEDVDYLRSERAVSYVRFNARRALFNDAFEKRFYALQDMGELETQYPEAANLFEDAKALLKKRDDIIEQIALTLTGGAKPTEEDMENAKTLWRARYLEEKKDRRVKNINTSTP